MVLQETPPAFRDEAPSARTAGRNCPLVVLLVASLLLLYSIWDFFQFARASGMGGLLGLLGMAQYGTSYVAYLLMAIFLFRMAPWARRATLVVIGARVIVAYLWLGTIAYFQGMYDARVTPDLLHRLIFMIARLLPHLGVTLLTLTPLVLILMNGRVREAFAEKAK